MLLLFSLQRDLCRLTSPSAYVACDRSSDTVWSEYRFRIVTTSLMKSLAAAHRLDFLQGRLVAYVTSPLVPRGFTVLLMDHGIHNMVKRWKQDIFFAVPHHQATRHRQDAIARITLFFYKSANYRTNNTHTEAARTHPGDSPDAVDDAPISPATGVDAADAAVAAASASASSQPTPSPSPPPVKPSEPHLPVTGFVSDLYTEPIRVGECIIDLMSIREVTTPTDTTSQSTSSSSSSSAEKAQLDDARRQAEVDEDAAKIAEDEEEQAAHAHARQQAHVKQKKKTKKQLREEEKERQRKEWQAKWIPVVSSARTPPPTSSDATVAAAPDDALAVRRPSLCLNVKRTVHRRSSPYRPTTTAVRVHFSLFGLSVINGVPEEVVYTSISGVDATITDSQWQTTIAANIDAMQVDNHRRQAAFPIVFNPTPLQGDVVVQPLVQMAVNMRKRPPIPRTTIIPYFSLLVQKMDVRVEEINIWRSLAFLNAMMMRFGGDLSADLDQTNRTRRLSDYFAAPPTGTNRLYFKLLHVQPIAVNVSFVSNPGQREATHFQVNPFYTLIHMLQAGIGNINEAPLRLNGKLIENAVGSSQTIIWSLLSHYIQQGVMEAYKIFGSVEFLGNPVTHNTNAHRGDRQTRRHGD